MSVLCCCPRPILCVTFIPAAGEGLKCLVAYCDTHPLPPTLKKKYIFFHLLLLTPLCLVLPSSTALFLVCTILVCVCHDCVLFCFPLSFSLSLNMKSNREGERELIIAVPAVGRVTAPQQKPPSTPSAARLCRTFRKQERSSGERRTSWHHIDTTRHIQTRAREDKRLQEVLARGRLVARRTRAPRRRRCRRHHA